MNYEIIFFDLDGTLIDPKDSITKSVQFTLSKFGIKAELKELIPFIGPPLDDSLKKYYGFDEKQAKLAIEYYRKHFFENGINEVETYEGVLELLKKLKKKNKKLNIVSTKFKITVKKIAKEHQLEDYFDNIVGAKIDGSNFGKPILVKEALDFYPEKDKQSFVMIGDREHDIFGAQANGIDSIGVLYGYGSEDEIQKSKPTHIVANLEKLEELLLENTL